MPQIQEIFVAGTIAAMIMAAVISLISAVKKSKVNFILILGTLFSKQRKTALTIGFVIHIVFGLIFAYLYSALWRYLGIEELSLLAITGTVIGFFHGFIVSFSLVVSVEEHHPIRRYQKEGFAVALSYIVGHMIFGAALGTLVGIM